MSQYYDEEHYTHRSKHDPRDVFRFKQQRPPLLHERWFDKHGNQLRRETHNTFPRNVAFVVTEDGEVMATAMPEWGVATFVHPETGLPDLAAAQAVRFYLDKMGKTQVEYAWLKCDKEAEDVDDGTLSSLLLKENSSLPLTSFDGHLRHYSDIHMPNSSRTLPVLRRWLREHDRGVGCWTASVNNQPKYTGIDVYDALEFYFVPSAYRVWRTRIGELIWTIVKPYVWNMVAVQHLLVNIRHWRPVLTKRHGACDFCSKPQVALFRIQCKRGGHLSFDQRCLAYAHRFQQLGRFIRKLHTKNEFLPTFVEDITHFLEKLSQTFI